jgi:hypothetical protein
MLLLKALTINQNKIVTSLTLRARQEKNKRLFQPHILLTGALFWHAASIRSCTIRKLLPTSISDIITLRITLNYIN